MRSTKSPDKNIFSERTSSIAEREIKKGLYHQVYYPFYLLVFKFYEIGHMYLSNAIMILKYRVNLKLTF